MPTRRSRTPLLLQFEAAECGAAALGIVLRQHGRWVPLEELRTVCGVSRDGTNALNLVRAAHHYGLHAEGLRRTTLTGLRELPLPAILFVRGDPDPADPTPTADRPGNHFVVLEAVTADRAYLNDPAAGHRSLALAELLAYSAGVVITAQPGPNFVRAGQPFRWRSVLADGLAGQRGAVLRVLVISAGLLIPGLLLPMLLQRFVDRVLIGMGGADALTAVLAGLILALVLRMALLWLHGRAVLHLETTLTLTSSDRVFRHLLRLPLPFFLNRYAGDLALRLQLSERISRVLARDAAGTLLNLILMIAYAALLWAYSPLLAAIGLAAVALTFLLLRRIDAQRGDHLQRLQQQRAHERAAALDGLAALETLQAAGLEGVLFNRWAGLNAAAAVTEQQVSRLTERTYALLPLVLAVSTTLVLTGGAGLVMRGDLTIGMLVAAQSLLAGFTAPVSQLAAFAAQIPQLETDLHRLDDLLRCPPRPLPAPVDDTPLLRARDGQLDVYGLTFGYAPLQPPLLENVRFSVAPGTLAVIHAPSGTGKSTLARLIAGLLTPWAGEIYLSGTPLGVQRGRISYADQTITLFPGTFLDNLRLYNADLPISAIVQAAQDAGIHEFILAHGGYHGRVNENGRGLSGGQRQCLELARALARNPALLILDETTSALDPDTEAAILERLRRRGCTTLLISHRASVRAAADQVITL